MQEEWRTIREFPEYEISNYGRVAHKAQDILIRTSHTLQGGLKVGLTENGKQYTRSVKVLVADAFVDGKSPHFNTPIILDGDQNNCSAQNLMWRPRWFAWHYTNQFKNVLDIYRKGPIVEVDQYGDILEVYMDTYEVGITFGLQFYEVWSCLNSPYDKKPVFPTGQFFDWPNKV